VGCQNMKNMKKLTIINGSYRKNGFTIAALEAEAERLIEKYDMMATFYHLDDDLVACRFCDTCVMGCRFKDQFQELFEAIKDSDRVMFGSPVYLDFPSPKLLAFLSRLGFCTEKDDRKAIAGKKAHIVACGYCSGTKTVVHTLMGAIEMCGFDIEGRSTKEYISLWKDGKVRGGMKRGDESWIPQESLKKLRP